MALFLANVKVSSRSL